MSHFAVLAFIPKNKTLDQVMAPYHEFEFTGADDEFVQDIDITEDVIANFNEDKMEIFVLPDGKYKSVYDKDFYRYPTEEERKLIGIGGSGVGHGLIWSSRDWGDGKGYGVKVRYTPDLPKKEITMKEYYGDLKSYLIGYDGYKESKFISNISEKNEEDHKYGYVLESNGSFKVIRRTNPNSKWDWYSLGGRWNHYFTVNEGTPAQFEFEAKRLSGVEECEIENAKLIELLKSGGITPEQMERKLSKLNPWKALTWAFIDENGNWNERGKMGWFACSNNENENEYYGENGGWWSWIRQLPQDAQLCLVDCHI